MTSHKNLLLGWDVDTWRRAIDWAGLGDPPLTLNEIPRLSKIRRKWLDHGGPVSGPASDLVLNG